MAKREFRLRVKISILCLIALLLGGIMRFVNYKSWFALSNYKVDAEAPILEERLWKFFPEDCVKFWPYFINEAKGLSEFLERDLPVSVKTEMHGLGNFTTKIRWLEAWLSVEWRGEIWNISRDGKMWALNQEGLSDSKSNIQINPVWKIPENANLDGNVILQASSIGVFKSPISTEVIGSFIDEFRGCEWFDNADSVTWERRAGLDLFVLRVTHGRQNFEILIQREKYAGQDLGAIIGEVFNKLLTEGGSHIIDATYEGKILLRKL